MRRLAVALVLSLGIHGLLLSSEWHRDQTPPMLSRINIPISVQLAYLPKPVPPQAPKQPQPLPPPEIVPPKVPQKPAPLTPPPPKPPQKVVKPKPKPRVRPSKVKPKPPPIEKAISQKPVTKTQPVSPMPEPPAGETEPKKTALAHTVTLPPKLPSSVETPREAPAVEQGPPVASIIPTLKKATPLYKRNPAPQYPRLAKRRGYQGTVLLEVLVNPQGRVDDLKVIRSSGYSVLDKAATSSVKDWLFEPGLRGDQAVEMWVRVPVRFKLQ